MNLNSQVAKVTERIGKRSRALRTAYVERMQAARDQGSARGRIGCANLAHAFAASKADKPRIKEARWPNLGIVSAYNDMLSAHQPLQKYPDIIKQAARDAGATAQFAGGVPAMCDGVTQGEPGMELSLFSRDVIAMSTAISLSHNVFDGVLCLGVCDKIVPGLLIGALQFGHLPCIMVPAGPMPSGLPNSEKAKVRQLYAQGKATREELLEAESRAYHSPGTCTFYGTANTNQMLMELMGLHIPGSAFVNPNVALRDHLTRAAATRLAKITSLGDEHIPLFEVVDERSIINGVVGLLATGGSTNHTLHIVAIARAAGILIDWNDFAELSAVVPLLARIYPNGVADVNHFQAAGGFSFLIRELMDAGLLHEDVRTIAGAGLQHYCKEPWLDGDQLKFRNAAEKTLDEKVLRDFKNPFSADGGLRLLSGNLGRSVIKVSAVAPENRVVEAPVQIFDSQEEVQVAFRNGDLHKDFIAVVRFQGPRANGMPELHKLTPPLGILQDEGFKVALITDGRMSGASGKVPAAIHLSPEALADGPIAKLRDGDRVRLDANAGRLEALVSESEWSKRAYEKTSDLSANEFGMGRELFAGMRAITGAAEQGAMSFGWTEQELQDNE